MAIDESELIAGFYEAALDATLFPDRLRQLAEFGHGIGARLLLWDKQAGAPALLATSGHMGADASEAYRREYAAVDPYRPIIAARPLGQWTASDDIFDARFVAENKFFNEFLIPHGIARAAGTCLVAGQRVDAFLCIHRGPGHATFSKGELAKLTRLGQHLERAVRFYVDRAQTRPAYNAALAVLEHAAPPAVLVDQACVVLFASPSAEAVLVADVAIGLRNGRLNLHRQHDESRLRRLVAGATRTHQPVGGEMLIERGAGGPPLALSVVPGGPTVTLHSLTPVPAALVLFRDPTHHAANLAERLRALFNLTAAEVALARGLLEGRRLREIAAARRVSLETVRTQLRAVFRKTGVARQTDLVRMLQAVLQPVST